MSKPGYIYLLQGGDWCKIGKSAKVEKRVRGLTLMPFVIKIVHTIPVSDMKLAESALHRHFQSKRVNGEWFELDQGDIQFVCSIASEADIPQSAPAAPRVSESASYTVKEISDHFHVSRQAVYDWIKEGKLRAIKLGERVRVPDSALRDFIQEIKPGEALPENG